LPLFNNPAINGNLFIYFEIEFPNRLNQEEVSLIQQALKTFKPKDVKLSENAEKHVLVPFDLSHVNKNEKKKGEA